MLQLVGKIKKLLNESALRCQMGVVEYNKYMREYTLKVFEHRMSSILNDLL